MRLCSEKMHISRQLFARLEVGDSPGTVEGPRTKSGRGVRATPVGDVRRVATTSGLGQHRGVEVGREDLRESSRFEAIEVLAQQMADE